MFYSAAVGYLRDIYTGDDFPAPVENLSSPLNVSGVNE